MDIVQNRVIVSITPEDVTENKWISIQTDNGISISLDSNISNQLADIMKQNSSSDIRFALSFNVNTSKLSSEAASRIEEAMKKGTIVFDFSFIDPATDAAVLCDLSSGKIVADIPLTPEQLKSFPDPDNLVVVSVADNGTIEYMDTWYDPATNKLTFAASQFSVYMVMEDDRLVDTTIKPDDWMASLDKFDEMAKSDYEEKHGNTKVVTKSEATKDGAVKISIEDNNGNVLDVYTIDPKTGTGTNQKNETVDLPQTGVTAWDSVLIFHAAFALLLFGLWMVVAVSRKKHHDAD